jgi:hypothetical protein
MRGARIIYSDTEMAWLEANRTMVISDYHRAFQAEFSRPDVSAMNLHGLRKRKGWKTGREGDRYKGRHRKFTAAEMAWLEANRLLPIADYHRTFIATFPREDVNPANLHALRKRMGWKTGRTGQFEKGQTPANKGKRCPEGQGGRHPNAQRTQFRKGATPHTYRGAGHERIDSKDGYVVMIVDEPNPWSGAKTRPVHKHRWLWEQANGPIPDGFCLKCLDGNKLNTDPSNWALIARGVLPHLNGGRFKKRLAYDAAAPELKPALMTAAKIKHALHTRRKDAA